MGLYILSHYVYGITLDSDFHLLRGACNSYKLCRLQRVTSSPLLKTAVSINNSALASSRRQTTVVHLSSSHLIDIHDQIKQRQWSKQRHVPSGKMTCFSK